MAALLSASTLLFLPAAWAETKLDAFQFYIENDSFASKHSSDRWYTNGVKAMWTYQPGSTSGDPLENTPETLRPLYKWLKPLVGGSPDKLRFGAALGQNIYTPADIRTAAPQPNDRPWAGWLYASAIAQSSQGRTLTTLELKLGIVGPAALAGPTQKWVHEIVDAPQPQGWGHQLKNEPGFMLSYTKHLGLTLLPDRLNISPYLGGALGNVKTHVNAGVTVIVGNALRNDSTPGNIGEGDGDSLFDPTGKVPTRGRAHRAWYGFLQIDAKYVARNIFLDGNTFQDSPHVSRRRSVGQLSWGVALPLGIIHRDLSDLQLSLVQFVRTPEFDVSAGTSEPRQRFGALMLSWSFSSNTNR